MEKRGLKSVILFAGFFWVAYFLGGISFCPGEEGAPGQLKLLIEINKHMYQPEEPIYLECKIENLTNAIILLHPIAFDNLQIFLKHEVERGELPLGSRIFPLEMLSKEQIIRLQPATSVRFRRTIKKEFYHVPEKTGRYELYSVYSSKTESLGGVKLWTGELKSNVLEFEIREQP